MREPCQYVALSHVVERALYARTIGARTGRMILKNLVASRRSKCIELQRRVLVEGADAGVASERHPVLLSVYPSGNHIVRIAVYNKVSRTEGGGPLNERLADTPAGCMYKPNSAPNARRRHEFA